MQWMPRSSSTSHQPLKHDIEALAEEPRIGALEGKRIGNADCSQRAARRAATPRDR
jgi:hypothetical protein